MVSVKFVFLCICYFVFEANCGSVSYVTPCKPTDAACILKSGQNALPHAVAGDKELGLEPSDPLSLGKVVCDTDQLKLTLDDLVLEGASKCNLKDVKRDLEKSQLYVKLHCSHFSIFGKYVAGGKILGIDVFGNGDCNIHGDDMEIDAVIAIKEVEHSDGQKYWEASRVSADMEPSKEVHLHFKNLFDGDAVKAKPVEDILKHSSYELVKSFGKPILERAFEIVLTNLNQHWLNVIPVTQLELP